MYVNVMSGKEEERHSIQREQSVQRHEEIGLLHVREGEECEA